MLRKLDFQEIFTQNSFHSLFYGCNRLFEITIPPSIQGIAAYQFMNYVNLRRITLGDVRATWEWCLAGCENLKEVVLPPKCTRIGWAAFSGSATEKLTILTRNEDILVSFGTTSPCLEGSNITTIECFQNIATAIQNFPNVPTTNNFKIIT